VFVVISAVQILIDTGNAMFMVLEAHDSDDKRE
jgi:hypothetical protein